MNRVAVDGERDKGGAGGWCVRAGIKEAAMLMNASIKGLRDTSLKALVHVTSDSSFEKNQSKPSCMGGWVSCVDGEGLHIHVAW